MNLNDNKKVAIIFAFVIIAIIGLFLGIAVGLSKKNREEASLNSTDYDSTKTEYEFVAEIISVDENHIIVKPDANTREIKSGDRISIGITRSTNGTNDFYVVGNKVKITYDGTIMETYPAQIYAIKIELVNQNKNNEINWDEITTEGVNEQKLFKNVNTDDLEKIATLFQNLSHEIGEKQEDFDFYFTGQWYNYMLESSQFNEVLNMGNNALKPLYLIIYKSPNQGIYEYICCMAIQKITNYDVGEWTNSKDFLEKFNNYICNNR